MQRPVSRGIMNAQTVLINDEPLHPLLRAVDLGPLWTHLASWVGSSSRVSFCGLAVA